MAETPISKSQSRLLSLLGIQHSDTYAHASNLLTAAGMPADGLPTGHTWRTAGKLSDAELLAALPKPATFTADAVDSGKREGRPSWYQQAKGRRSGEYETEADREFADEVRMAGTPFGTAD